LFNRPIGLPPVADRLNKEGVFKTIMSPKILKEGAFVFRFHSYDARHEERASVHVGKGSQDDFNDAKVWLEPEIELAKTGHTLRERELRQALKIIEENPDYLLEEWRDYKHKAG
jgi:hypothetical protein